MNNHECTKQLLKLFYKEEGTDPSTFKYLDFRSIMKIRYDLLDFFMRMRVQEDLADKWKDPTKGNKEKVKEGKRYM